MVYIIKCTLPWQKRGRGMEKSMTLMARFQKLRGEGAYYYRGAEFSEGQGELNYQRGLVSWGLATMFFCKSAISEATLLLIIHVTYVYSNIFDRAEFLTQKTIMSLFSHKTIKSCFNRKAYSKIALLSTFLAVQYLQRI